MMITTQSIKAAADRIVAAAHSPLKVVLFGSYATGQARENSDIDLIVVEDHLPDLPAEYNRLRGAVGDLGAGVDLLLYSREEFERRANWRSSPVYDAVRHGKVIYERPAL